MKTCYIFYNSNKSVHIDRGDILKEDPLLDILAYKVTKHIYFNVLKKELTLIVISSLEESVVKQNAVVLSGCNSIVCHICYYDEGALDDKNSIINTGYKDYLFLDFIVKEQDRSCRGIIDIYSCNEKVITVGFDYFIDIDWISMAISFDNLYVDNIEYRIDSSITKSQSSQGFYSHNYSHTHYKFSSVLCGLVGSKLLFFDLFVNECRVSLSCSLGSSTNTINIKQVYNFIFIDLSMPNDSICLLEDMFICNQEELFAFVYNSNLEDSTQQEIFSDFNVGHTIVIHTSTALLLLSACKIEINDVEYNIRDLSKGNFSRLCLDGICE